MSGAFLIIFTLFWSGMTLAFDGFMARGIFKQYESSHYSSVTGIITHSEVKTSSTSKGGTSYTPVIEYQFEVGGRHLTGDKLRLGMTSWGYSSAHATVNAHPVGSSVPVFYNPNNPEESLLSPGVMGSDLMVVLFMSPFNMVMLGFWLWIAGWLRERLGKPVAGGVKIIADGMTTRIRLPQFPAIAWGLVTVGGLGFILTFVLGFGTNMQPSVPLILSVIGMVYGAGIGVYIWQWQKINSGMDDLILNESSGAIELPLTFGRKQRTTVNVANITSLSVERILHRSNKGGVSYTYAPSLGLSGADVSVQKLADWSDEMKANAFTDWLRPKLNPNLPAVLATETRVAETEARELATAAASAKVFEEMRRDGTSRIKISDGPQGREFYFPPARNLGTTIFTTLMMFLFNGAAGFMFHLHAPVVFPIVFGLVGILLILGTFSLWFKSVRVTVNSTNVRLTKRWLIFSRTREFSAGDYARFATQLGMQSGSTIFMDIKLVQAGADAEFAQEMKPIQDAQQVNQLVVQRFRQAAGPRGVTVASSMANSAEAEWLVQQMNQALGRTQSTPAVLPEISTDETTDWSPPDVRPKKAMSGAVSALISIVMACGAGYWVWPHHSSATTSPAAKSFVTAAVSNSVAPMATPSQTTTLKVAFSSSGTNGIYGTNSWPVGSVGYGNWFVSKTTGHLTAIELSVEPANEPPERMMVAIAPDNGGFPGRALESFRVDGLVHTNTSGWLELDSHKQPALTAGTKYWIWVRSPGAWLWYFGSQNIRQDAAHLPKPRQWADAGYTNVCAFTILTETDKPMP